jgi:tRNA 2-thiouridine synthesizing protein A
MADIIDVRGFSCPQPVFETRKKMLSLGSGSFSIQADSPTARDNILRLAESEGWTVKVETTEGEYRITLEK